MALTLPERRHYSHTDDLEDVIYDLMMAKGLIELPLTREAMADYLGLTLETVSRQVSALKRDGVIELVGKRAIILPDYGRLVGESGDDADGGYLS